MGDNNNIELCEFKMEQLAADIRELKAWRDMDRKDIDEIKNTLNYIKFSVMGGVAVYVAQTVGVIEVVKKAFGV